MRAASVPSLLDMCTRPSLLIFLTDFRYLILKLMLEQERQSLSVRSPTDSDVKLVLSPGRLPPESVIQQLASRVAEYEDLRQVPETHTSMAPRA